jgi:transposase, IS5 family
MSKKVGFFPVISMYRSTNELSKSPEAFIEKTKFGLDENNRWVILSKIIPWAEFEGEYTSLFHEKMGRVAKSFREALGCLLIQNILNLTDRETVQQIKENPYLQYFLGFEYYEYKDQIDASTLVYFRKRISAEIINKINVRIVKEELKSSKDGEKEMGEKEGEENQGELILDATCIPSDLEYPTDLGLLNKGRETTNKYIDKLYKPLKGKGKRKPRTDRKQARRNYLKVTKKKKVKAKERKKAIKQQLRYLERNLENIEDLIKQGSSLKFLTQIEQKKLEVIKKLWQQQEWMLKNNQRSIEGRIVSIEQPYIRPIVRGKARQAVEFGAKISISYVQGYVFLDEISWENFNESTYLQKQVELYYQNFGYYPKSIHVDKIYRTKANRKYCQERGIRMSGPKLGRPPDNISKEEKQQALFDERIRNRVEGKFGEVKRRYGLDLIKTKLAETSENKIAMSILAMNLMTVLRRLLRFFCLFL